MLEYLMGVLNGAWGPDILRGLKGMFLILLGVAAFAVLWAPSAKPGKTSYSLLRWLFAGAFAAILCYQATWQLLGFTQPDFVKFMRRYNRRPNAAEKQVMRGPILDRRGMVLAAPVPGDVWGRRYPLGEAAVHPLGYYHSTYGITAVERVCDPALSGYLLPDKREDAFGALFAQRAAEGEAVTLTLDQRLQQKAYELLAGRKGAVVVMRPRSGALLALVSSPGFNPLDPAPAMADEANLPAFNRAVQARYPPGSTFKILLAGLALDQGLAPVFACPGQGYIAGPGTPPIRDSEYFAYARKGAVWPGWGQLGLQEALVHSSNVYFAQLGVVACPPEAFNALTARAFLNEPLMYLGAAGSGLQSARGNVPEVTRPRALALLAIGQGEVLATPLHVACFTAAAAADGRLMRPRLAAGDPVEELSRLFSEKTAAQLRGFLREAVVRGTGKGADVPGLEVCGKTGTAQAPGGEDHAWFTCFAPRRHPNLVVTVLVERGGFGARAALPVARELLEEADRLGYVRTAEEAGP
ncbi:MAG: penicillin-binding protein 2 [Verrucomicrobiota bacterium]|jgi:peptidoglycan glycosyltransferase|nr:penicillin-binding protein 2 [Verrucomicrobiota bacterium]